MPDAKQVPIRDVLSDDRLEQIRGKIANLPDEETFRNRVEQDLWHTLVDPSHQNDETIAYEDLSEVSKSVIGYVEDGEAIPWWLTSFRWQAQSRGEEVLLEKSQFDDSLADFENFDPSTTELRKPELQNIPILDVLNQFEKFADELGEHLDVATDSCGSL